MRNKVELIGHLGNDPEAFTFEDGSRVMKFDLATYESWRDKNSGERRTRTTWHKIEIYREGTANAVEKCLKKGSKVLVAGAIRYKPDTKDGVKRIFTSIVVTGPQHECLFLDPKADGHPPAEEGQDEPGSEG